MGFWKRLFGRPHASDSWQPVIGLPIALDMGKHTLCDVRLGDPVEWFSKLGPPEDKKALAEGCYRYLTKGIEIGAENGTVTDFSVICARDPFRPGFEPFRGTVIYKGLQISQEKLAVETDFTGIFSEPYRRDEDDTEIILFYEFRNNIEWQVEFTVQRTLKSLMIVTPPLMQDAETRANYHVTKSWPPRSY
jgi:hypothetical protein